MTPLEGRMPLYINSAGQVAGQIELPSEGSHHVFLTGPNGIDGIVLRTFGQYAVPGGVNDLGQVVGTFRTLVGNDRAFFTGPNGQDMFALGTLTEGTSSFASGINNVGQVVGYTATSAGLRDGHAFVWDTHAGMTDLNSLINPSYGRVFTEARAINNNGQVLVSGVPEPESYALLLAGLGLIGFMGRHRKRGEKMTILPDLDRW